MTDDQIPAIGFASLICDLSSVICHCLLAPYSGADESGNVMVPTGQVVSSG
jgi:hypothetical protein